MRKALWLVAAAALFLFPTAVLADSISPGSFSASIAVGGTASVDKTVTISEGGPTSALVDVFFLADATGSMFTAISNVKAGASSIMSTVAPLGDVAFAVGAYRDVGDAFVYQLNQDVTTSTAAAQAAINTWTAYGGGDGPEAQIYALKQVADTTSWRTGSTRIAVWFGDYEGHDPSNGVTLAQATAALVAKGIKVEAISVGYNRLNILGQATSLATATGGDFYSGIDPTALSAAISAAITTSFITYGNVTLDLSEVPAGLTATFIPLGGFSGDYTRAAEETFDFSLSFTGVTPGTYEFNVYALVDGGRVATEAERIVVGDGTKVPEPGTLLLLGSGLVGLVGYRRRARMM